MNGKDFPKLSMQRLGFEMKADRVQTYLRQLERQLWLRGLADAEILAEVESHLRESVEAGLRRGLSRVQAEQEALERFGSVKVVARTFETGRKTMSQKILLGVAVLMGLLIAFVDSRPTWDDTGITVGTMLLISGLLTLLGYRRPWLIALAIGLWMPLYEIYLSQNFRFPEGILLPLFVLLICFAGAYAGWAVRLGIRKTLHPA
jgi:hypothetical protein